MVFVPSELMQFQGTGVGFKGKVMLNYFRGVK